MRLSPTNSSSVVQHKRSRSSKSVDDSESANGRDRKRSKSVRSNASSKTSKRPREPSEDDDTSSNGTGDSYMDELKAKGEGPYQSKDVSPQPDETSSEEESLASLKAKERETRKEKRKKLMATTKKLVISSVSEKPTSKAAPKPSVASTFKPIRPKPLPLPYVPLSLNKIKPAKRKPGDTRSTIHSDERRSSKPLSLSHRYNIKKKQLQEPPPDASSIAIFRPDAVLTAAGRTMKSGRGYDKAVGDIDTAISISQQIPSPPPTTVSGRKDPLRADVERKVEIEKRQASLNPGRRNSVAEALAIATKIKEDAAAPKRAATEKPRSPGSSFTSPTDFSPSAVMDVDSLILADPWLNRRPSTATLRRISDPGVSSAHHPSLPPQSSDGSVNEVSHPRALPTTISLAEDDRRTWTGDLLYSQERALVGKIRLFLPQPSVRLKKLPKFSDSSIWLQKLISVQYLSKVWFSFAAHPRRKPECLLIEFKSKDIQQKLTHWLRHSDSAGLVLEKNFTLIFFHKQNERCRSLFVGDTSSNSIGVAFAQPLSLGESIREGTAVDQVRLIRKI